MRRRSPSGPRARPPTADRSSTPAAISREARSVPGPEPVPRRATPLRWALLVVLVLAVFAPTVRGDFLRWDDEDHVYRNPRVIESDGLLRSWLDRESPGFYPITYMTFYVEWRLAGGKPWLFHVDNVLLHAGNAVMVGLLCGELALSPVASWFVAALWALHPLQVASVAWIAERKNVLYVFLYLLSLHLYLRSYRGAAGSRRVAYVFSVLLFACALLSKAAAMTLPAAIVLIEWARRRRLDRDFWVSLVPYVAVAVGAGFALLGSVPTEMRRPSLASRLALAPRALWFYVRRFFWPGELLPMYPRWRLDAPGLRDYLAWLVVGGFSAAVAFLRDRLPRAVLAGVGLFFVNVSLVIGIVWFTLLEHSRVSDHLSYLPNLGLALATVTSIEQLTRAARVPETALVATLALWCAALGTAAWRRIPVWHDTETLWTYTIARNPDCPLCEYNLGVLLDDRGERDAAAEHYEAAMRIEPDVEAAINLGNARVAQGRLDEATALYEQAVELDPTNGMAHLNLGLMRASQGKTEEAIAQFREALRAGPRSPAAHRELGVALFQAGRAPEARKELEQALELAPGDAEAATTLAHIEVDNEAWDQAAAQYERALRGTATVAAQAATHRELAAVLDQLGRDDDALRHYRTAHDLVPEDPAATVDLASALVGRKRAGEAVALLVASLAGTPDVATLAAGLAWIRATSPDPSVRDGAEAVRLAERACSLGGYEDADQLDTLAAAYAEAGRFADAVRTARQALAATDPASDLAEGLRGRMALYEARQPYRSP